MLKACGGVYEICGECRGHVLHIILCLLTPVQIFWSASVCAGRSDFFCFVSDYSVLSVLIFL